MPDVGGASTADKETATSPSPPTGPIQSKISRNSLDKSHTKM
jgi:hypothetical protein